MGQLSFRVLLCAIAISAVTGCSGSGLDAESYTHASILNTLSLRAGYEGTGIAVQGSQAYVSTMAVGSQSGARSLVIVTLEKPTAPAILSTTSSGLTSDMAGIAVGGSYVYVPFKSSIGTNFQVWDVSNPISPHVVGRTSISCPSGMYPFNNSALYGKYVYISCFQNEVTTTGAFAIVDVSAPAAPSVVGFVSVTATYQPISMAISGQYLYVAATQGGSTSDYLLLYSIQNPSSPSLLATVSVPHSPQWVAAQGTVAVVPIYDGTELQVIDFSNPSSPQSYSANLGSCHPQKGMIYQGSMVFAPCDSPSSVAEVDLATVYKPSYLGTVLSDTQLTSLAASGSYLYGIDAGGNFDTIGFGPPGWVAQSGQATENDLAPEVGVAPASEAKQVKRRMQNP